MLYLEIENLLKEDNLMDVFFNKVAGQERVKIGNRAYIIPLNYETDEKKVVVHPGLPCLNLKNNNMRFFKEALTKYANTFFESEKSWANPIESCQDLEDKLVYALSSVWLNLTFDDYENPIRFLDRYTDFLNDKTFDDLFGGMIVNNMQTLSNCDLDIRIAEQEEFQETPSAIQLSVRKEDSERKLPRVAYGISDGIAYIYGIQGYKKKDESSDLKKVERAKYKLNNKDNIPEDYVNVYMKQEPFAYLSLFAFLSLLKQKGINKVSMPAYLPERYESKELGLLKYAKNLAKDYIASDLTHKEKKARLKKIEKSSNDHQRVQYNITNKFLTYMIRMSCDVPGIKLLETPDMNNSGLVVDISNMQVSEKTNIIFYELYRKIEEAMKNKRRKENER